MTRQELHTIRHENDLVLRAVRSGLPREEIETLLGSAPGATVEVCEPVPTRAQLVRSVGLVCERPGVSS